MPWPWRQSSARPSIDASDKALEKAAAGQRPVCIEAGVFPNEAIKQGYLAAQKALAPSVRFLWVDGQDDFRSELEPGLVEQIRQASNGNFVLGSPRFAEEIAAALGRRVTPGKSGRPRKPPEPKSGDLFM